MRGQGLNRGEIGLLEARLRAAVVSLNKRNVIDATMIEVVDEADVWPQGIGEINLTDAGLNVDSLLERVPLLICAIASEIGFAYEGVGTIFWSHFDQVIGHTASLVQRQRIAEVYRALAERYRLSHPTHSAFSEHFSIIAWPIANALLPSDLVGPVSRLLERAPVGALPGTGRSPNFASLRAWASAAEGARLVDWLRLEAPTARVLTALLTENRGSMLPPASYQRLRDAIAKQPDAFFSARAAHGVDCTDHLLLADNDIVEQTFKLRRHARIDQRRIGLLENAEQCQAGFGRHDVLSLGNQEALFLQTADDLGPGRRRANALGLLQAVS